MNKNISNYKYIDTLILRIREYLRQKVKIFNLYM